MSQKLGISAQAVQELGYVAKLSGSSQEGMADALGKLAKNADLAKNGSKDTAQAFRAVGVDTKKLIDGSLPLDEAFQQIAGALGKMPDGAAKSNLAMKLLGKSGRDMLPSLAEGADGIKRLRQEAEDTGAVIDNETSSALEGFGDQADKVKMQLGGLRNQAIKAVLPDLLELVKGMQAWIKANRADIVAGMTTAIRAMIGAVRAVFFVVKALVPVLGFLNRHTTLATILVTALTAAFGYLAIGAASAWIAVLGPIAAGIVLIALFAAHWEDLVVVFFTGAMKIGDGLRWIARKFADAIRGIKSAAWAIGSAFASVARSIGDAFKSMINWIIDKVNWAIGKINWMIRQFNRIPYIPNMGQIPTIGHLGGDGKKTAAMMPTRSLSTMGPGVGAATGANVNIGPTNINVNSTSADPAVVASLVDKKQREFWDQRMRELTMDGSLA